MVLLAVKHLNLHHQVLLIVCARLGLLLGRLASSQLHLLRLICILESSRFIRDVRDRNEILLASIFLILVLTSLRLAGDRNHVGWVEASDTISFLVTLKHS
jgi:hypothetical protein